MTGNQLPACTTWLIGAALAALAGCGDSSPDSSKVATWNDGGLPRAEYEQWIEHQNLERSPATVRELALITELADAARQRGAAERPEIQLAIERERQRILLAALDDHLNAQIAITPEEIDRLQETYPDAFQRPRKLLLRGIYKQLPETPEEQAAIRSRMAELRDLVLDGADLERLAQEESESQSRFRGGSIGWVDPSSLPEAVQRGVESLDTGEVSPLIELSAGVTFYACEGVRPAVEPGPEEVRSKFRQNLYRQKRDELNRQLREELTGRVLVSLAQDPVLTVGSYRLPAGWLDALIALRLPRRAPESLDMRQKQRLLAEWGMGVAMADHAESLGLDNSDHRAEALRWRLTHALAQWELRHRVDSRLTPPTEAALRAEFEQNRDRLRNPPAFRLLAIQFANAENATEPDAVAAARRVVARVRSGELPFEQAARMHSLHPSARTGGVLGWKTRRQLGSLDMKLLQAVRQLSPGDDTGLMRSQSGLWMARLLESREAGPMTFDEARETLTERLRRSRIERLESEVREQAFSEMQLRIALD
ncbi:peptidylprolyl isomerase [Wenzhouxiangella sediminis]|nr:peptidylprolyl isomerase [Wenzhouxiangella sediminis]